MKTAKHGLLGGGRIILPAWSALVLIFAVCFYCFGLLLSRLGFFQDDWHHVFLSYWYGVQGLERFLLTDRGPFSYLVYAFFFKVLGYTPAYWHWALMFVRFLTAALFWLSLRQIWPRHNSLTNWLALLFTIYPIFTLQPLSVAYMLHWSMYFVFMLSLFVMLFAIRHGKAFVLLTAVAVALEAYHLVSIEYFSGLELSRPILLWLMFSGIPRQERLKKTFRYSLPYLAVLALYVVYRSLYSTLLGYDRFSVLSTLAGLAHAPLSGLAGILQYMVQDFVYVVFSQWFTAIDPKIIDLSRGSTYVIFGSALCFAIAGYLLMSRLDGAEDESDISKLGGQVALAGVLSVILAILPFWVTGLSIFQKNQLWSERLALAAMPGAGMILTGAVHALIDRRSYRHLVLSALLGLGISLPVQTARSFQASWDKQQQFYWELHWRAPSLQPNTLIVSDQEILFYMGIYPTAFAINLLYPQVEPWPTASYWFNAGSEHVNWDKFIDGEPVTFEKYTEKFTTTAQNVVAITFEPGLDQCLWVLRPIDANLRSLSPEAQNWLTVSNLSRIQAAPETTPPPAIFGKEPEHSWCYYYEQADLASVSGNWGKILQLWKEASQQRLRARNGVELMPFIEAYAKSGDWESARKLTMQAQVLPDRSVSLLCELWRGLSSATPASAGRDEAVAAVEGQLACQK